MRHWGNPWGILAGCLLIFVHLSSAWGQHPERFWKGNASAQKEPFIQIVETSDEWNKIWLNAFEKAAPEVDFHRQVVACVFLGHQADWLYSISIGEPVRRGGVWVVPYGLADVILELSRPFQARGQYAMKVLERKKDAPMILEKSEGAGNRLR